MGNPVRTIASMLGLAGFIVALLSGMLVGNDATSTLVRALLAMIVCQLVGIVLGAIGKSVIDDHLNARQAARAAVAPVGVSDEPIIEVSPVEESESA
ncbi:MAG: hypothetical protein AB7Q00_13270 [Phycisphaerales bacterium]|nr:MAG: hypothetical protein IPK69_03955 [Phycisphaerales bacterium]